MSFAIRVRHHFNDDTATGRNHEQHHEQQDAGIGRHGRHGG